MLTLDLGNNVGMSNIASKLPKVKDAQVEAHLDPELDHMSIQCCFFCCRRKGDTDVGCSKCSYRKAVFCRSINRVIKKFSRNFTD